MLFTKGRQRILDQNGEPVERAKVSFFLTQTTTPSPVYADAALTAPLTQPVRTDGYGYLPPIYYPATLLKAVVTDENDAALPDGIVDPINQTLTAVDIASLISPRTTAEIAAGKTPANYLWPESTPERYGAIGDGTTDDYIAFAAAIAVNKAGGQMVRCRMRTYKINSGLVLDPLFSSIDLCGATLDFSSHAGSHFSIDSSTALADNVATIGAVSRGVHNGRILCNASGIAFDLHDDDTLKALCFLQFSRLAISNYGTGFKFGSGAFEICVSHVTFFPPPGAVSRAVHIPSGGTNYGERLVFDDCGFQNCDIGIDNQAPDCIVHVINTSFDYLSSQIIILRNGASVIASKCHFESSTDTQLWFDVDGDNSLLRITDSTLLLTGSRATYPIGSCGSAITGGGGIEILDSKIGVGPGLTYAQDYLISGTGRVVTRNLSLYTTPGDAIAISRYNNSVWNYTLASATLTEYTLAGDVPPTRDTTTGHSDSNSLKLNPGGSQTSILRVIRPCQPGEMPTFGFYWKATNLDGSNLANISIVYYHDAAFALQTGTGGNGTITTNTGTFTRYRQQAQGSAPSGTGFVLFTVSLPAGNARTLWVDDVIACYG